LSHRLAVKCDTKNQDQGNGVYLLFFILDCKLCGYKENVRR